MLHIYYKCKFPITIHVKNIIIVDTLKQDK